MRLFISKPFKGNMFYEWQVGSIVLQWQHDMDVKLAGDHGQEIFHLGRFAIWRDQSWRDHMLLLPRWLRLTFVGDLVCDWKRRNRLY